MKTLVLFTGKQRIVLFKYFLFHLVKRHSSNSMSLDYKGFSSLPARHKLYWGTARFLETALFCITDNPLKSSSEYPNILASINTLSWVG